MSANLNSVDPTPAENRKRRGKALLAGGLVLGLGAVVTLAAWSDDVLGDGNFVTGAFELQGNISTTDVGYGSGGWQDYDADTGTTPNSAPLSFTQSLGGDTSMLSPGHPVHAPLALRLSPETTSGADVLFNSIAIGQIGSNADGETLEGRLDYAVHSGVTGSACALGDTSGGATVASGAIDDAPAAHLATLPNPGGAEEVVPLCLTVTLTDDSQAAQGIGETTVEWRFEGIQN